MGKMFKLAILALSMVPIMSGAAVAPALGDIAAAFPDASVTLIKMVMSLPALVIIPVSLLTGTLARFIPKRSIILVGLLVHMTGGIGGGFASGIYSLLFFRALLGVGVGMVIPFCTGLVADFFKGKEREQMMGWTHSASSFSGVIVMICAGRLSAINWRFAFSIYVLALFVLLMVALFVPEPPRANAPVKTRGPLPGRAYRAAFYACMLMLGFYVLPTNIAMLIKRAGMGTASVTGLAISSFTVAGFFAGLALPYFRKALGAYWATACLAMLTGGIYLIGVTDSLLLVFVAIAVAGFGFGILLPSIFLFAASRCDAGQNTRAMSLVMSMMFVGQFLSPIALDSMGTLLNGQPEREGFWIVTCLGAAALIVAARKALRVSFPSQRHS